MEHQKLKQNTDRYRLANVAGTQEPIYGPSAIKSVATEAEKTSYTEIGRDGMKWQAMDSTCVETSSFYIFGDNGYVALAQVIYSNVAYVSDDPSYYPSLTCSKAAFEQPASSTQRSSKRTLPSPTSGAHRPSTTKTSARTR